MSMDMPDSDWCTSVAALKSTCWRTGSGCVPILAFKEQNGPLINTV